MYHLISEYFGKVIYGHIVGARKIRGASYKETSSNKTMGLKISEYRCEFSTMGYFLEETSASHVPTTWRARESESSKKFNDSESANKDEMRAAGRFLAVLARISVHVALKESAGVM